MNIRIPGILFALMFCATPLMHAQITVHEIKEATPKLLQAIDATNIDTFMGTFDRIFIYSQETPPTPELTKAYTKLLQKLETKALDLRSYLQAEWQKKSINISSITTGLALLLGGLYTTAMAPIYVAWHRSSGNDITQSITGSISAFAHYMYIAKPYEYILDDNLPLSHAVPLLVGATSLGLYAIKNGAQKFAIGCYYHEYLDQKLHDTQVILNHIEKAKVLLEISTREDVEDENTKDNDAVSDVNDTELVATE